MNDALELLLRTTMHMPQLQTLSHTCIHCCLVRNACTTVMYSFSTGQWPVSYRDFQVPMEQVKNELRHKSDSKVDGLSVKVRGTDRIIHADGSVTRGPALSDGQLQHRADTGAMGTILLGASVYSGSADGLE